MAFVLKTEHDAQKSRALLNLSAASYLWLNHLMWAFLLFGITAAFMGGWQARVWPWLSLVLGFLIFVGMAAFGANHYAKRANF